MTATSSDRFQEAIAPPATRSIATPQPRTREEEGYVEAILPLTERLVGEGRLLAELGAARSRNILELRARAERFRAAADEIVAYESVNDVPPRLVPFSTALNAGIGSALAAIEQAEAAVLRFDWDEVQLAVTTFSNAVDQIVAATIQVEQA